MSKIYPPLYLDHAATTPLDPEVLAAMQPFLTQNFYNPSSLYEPARLVRGAIEDSRWRMAQVLGAKKTEIIFTAGGTESINLAILGVMRALSQAPDRGSSPSKFVTTAIEHEAVLACLPALERQGHGSIVVPVEPSGIVDVNNIVSAIDDQTVLVSVMYANNEIGTIQPIRDISHAIHSIRLDRLRRGITNPLYLHSDACQAAGTLDLHVSRLGVDLMSLNGSKIYGPKQTGCLYVRTGTPLEPLVYGGGQERGVRSGTENVAGIIGLSTALKLVQQTRIDETKRLTAIREYAWKGLQAAVPDVILNGHSTKRLAGNLNVTIPGINGETAVFYLDREGIMASTGSACSTGNTDPSHVLLALGRTRQLVSASLRFSFGHDTTKPMMDQLIKTLVPVVRRLRQLAYSP